MCWLVSLIFRTTLNILLYPFTGTINWILMSQRRRQTMSRITPLSNVTVGKIHDQTSNVRKLCEKEIDSILGINKSVNVNDNCNNSERTSTSSIDNELETATKSINTKRCDQTLKDGRSNFARPAKIKKKKSVCEKNKDCEQQKDEGKENVPLNETSNQPTTSNIIVKPVTTRSRSKGKTKRPQQSSSKTSETVVVLSSEVNKIRLTLKTDISPIREEPNIDSKLLISGRFRRPRIAKLIKKPREDQSSGPEIYHEEFLEEIIETTKEQAMRVVLPENFLSEYNPDKLHREEIVNWILKLQDLFKLHESEVYLAVNLLDQVLARILVPKSMYKLVSVACMWISNKFLSNDDLQLLVKLSSYTYRENQLPQMEKKILKILDYHIHSVEPSVFVNINLKKLNIDTISNTQVFFIVDIAAHLEEFSTNPAYIVAAASMIVACKFFSVRKTHLVIEYFNKQLSANENIQCKTLQVAVINKLNDFKHNDISEVILSKYKDCSWLIRREMWNCEMKLLGPK